MSKMNFTPTVSINELRKMIPLIASELTVVIQSEPGCGKTSLLGMMQEDHGDKYDYIYVDCPVKDMSDKLLLAEVFLEHSCEEMLPEVPADVAVLIIKVL